MILINIYFYPLTTRTFVLVSSQAEYQCCHAIVAARNDAGCVTGFVYLAQSNKLFHRLFFFSFFFTLNDGGSRRRA